MRILSLLLLACGLHAQSIFLTTSYTASLGTVAPPTFSSGSASPITLSDTNSGLSGFSMTYCTDSVNTCTPSTSYTAPVAVLGTGYIRAKATATGYAASAIGSTAYTIATGASDDFNRANAGTLGANWSILGSGGNMEITSNSAQGFLNNASDYYSGTTFTSDQFSQATNTGTTGKAYLSVRASGSGGYACYWEMGWEAVIVKFSTALDIGGFTYLGLGAADRSSGDFIANGDVVRCEVVGSTINFKRNGTTILSRTDSTFTSGSPGLGAYYLGFDNWSGGNIP